MTDTSASENSTLTNQSSVFSFSFLSFVSNSQGAEKISRYRYPCGQKLLEYKKGSSSREGVMTWVENTLPDHFFHYISDLLAAGFTEIRQNKIDQNLYAELFLEKRRILLSYTAAEHKIAVIEESLLPLEETKSEDIESEPVEKTDKKAEFFLYGLNMDPGGYNPALAPNQNTSGYPNCGMLLAIRSPDNGIIVVDGGMASQFRCGGLAQLDAFFHQITGKSEEEVVNIRAWLLTHFHPDHMEGFYHLLRTYPTHYRLEKIICNLPSLAMFPNARIEAELTDMAELIRTQYPDCQEHKVHTGESLTVGGVRLDILYTHEDNADPSTGRSQIRDINDTGIVVKASYGDASLLILGDINEISEQILVRSFSETTLHSDIIQVSHHGFNHLSDIYRLASAPIAWFTQTEYGIVKNEMTKNNSGEVKKYSREYRFAGDITRTTGFSKEGGIMKEIYQYQSYLPGSNKKF